MKKLLAIAGFLLASTAAQAQYTFEYGGRTITIDPDRGTVSIPGVYDNSGRRSKRSHNDKDGSRKPAPEEAKIDPETPATAPALAEPAPAPAVASPAPEPSTATANVAPADTPAATPPAAPAPQPQPQPQVQQDPAPAAKPAAPAPVVATAPTAAPAPPTPASTPNSPLGLWLTEEKEGKVRIEQCGANLCGYS